jgi:hypothetical protein
MPFLEPSMSIRASALASRLLLLAGLGAFAAGVPAAGDPGSAPELEPVTVIAPAAPLDRSLQLLRALVRDSTPCLGCDAAPLPAREPALLELLLASEPPQPDEATRLQREIKLKDSPDLEYLRR